MISTETMYTKLDCKYAASGCKNSLIMGKGSSFSGFPEIPKW